MRVQQYEYVVQALATFVRAFTASTHNIFKSEYQFVYG